MYIYEEKNIYINEKTTHRAFSNKRAPQLK